MSEIYIEGRFKMQVINTDKFGYDEEEVKKIDWEEFAEEEFWNSCEFMAELEDKYDITFHKVQPQLTIPKSIAELLDEIPIKAKEYVRVNDFGEYSVLDDFVELREFYEADEDDIFPKFMELKDFVKDNLNLCVMYLAGKALGVDLVKVVEG